MSVCKLVDEAMYRCRWVEEIGLQAASGARRSKTGRDARRMWNCRKVLQVAGGSDESGGRREGGQAWIEWMRRAQLAEVEHNKATTRP